MSLLYSFDIGTCVTNKLTTGFTVHFADNGSVMWIICKSKGWSNQVINLCVIGDAPCGSRVYRRKSRVYEQNTRQDHPIGNTEKILQHYKYIYIYIHLRINLWLYLWFLLLRGNEELLNLSYSCRFKYIRIVSNIWFSVIMEHVDVKSTKGTSLRLFYYIIGRLIALTSIYISINWLL